MCPFCSSATQGETCSRCKKSKKLQKVISLFDYDHPGVQNIIATIKYKGLFSLIEELKTDMFDVMAAQNDKKIESTILVPAPIRKESFLERGFNQAAYIAHVLHKSTGIPIQNILSFSGNPRAQHKQTQSERWKNTFERVHVSRLAKDVKHAIVVDDLLTTGATLESCADALLRCGIREVSGFTLARQKKFTT